MQIAQAQRTVFVVGWSLMAAAGCQSDPAQPAGFSRGDSGEPVVPEYCGECAPAVETPMPTGDAGADSDAQVPTEVPATPEEPAAMDAGVPAGCEAACDLTLGPILGAVTDRSIKVWSRGSGPVDYEVRYRAAGDEEWLLSESVTLSPDDDWTAAVDLGELSAATSYEYEILLGGRAVAESDFTTLGDVDEPGVTSFAFGADIGTEYKPYVAIERLLERDVGFAMLIGDVMYADRPDTVPPEEEAYFERYRAHWDEPHFLALSGHTPLLMMWDDHEIINDWYPGLDDRYSPARRAYDLYQGLHNPDPVAPGEIYYSGRAPGVDYFVVDVRSHRSPPNDPDGAEKSMLGERQVADLLAWLDTAQGPFKFIVSSVPFHPFGTTGNDAWEGYAYERQRIFDHIEDNGIEGVVLLTGDQHWNGIFRLPVGSAGRGLYEFMPTPIAINNRRAPDVSDPRALFISDTYQAFGVFTVDTTSEPTLLFQLIDGGGQERCTMTLTLQDLRGTGDAVLPTCN